MSGDTEIRNGRRLALALLGGTMLAGMPAVAIAQDESGQAADQPTPAPAPQPDTIQSIAVTGAQRLEPQTILSYIQMRPGQEYSQAAADQALKELYATELFATASIRNNGGNVIIDLVENPVINRIILEGNKRLKNDKIVPEIKLAPRQIFTRSKVRADTARILELYKRQGRFAATVEPKIVELSQNRVDVVYEISEGPKSKVRQINIIGNEVFSDGDLRGEMVTKQSRFTTFFSSNTSYDPDRLAFDQQKLRQFYLTEGYADFRVVSAVAELTPDKEDFIITYVVEEGERYKFGEVSVDSQIRDFDSDAMSQSLPMKGGDWYDAKAVEDTVEQLTELAGRFGYAFADVRPQFRRSKEDLTMSITFVLNEAPRVYVERVDVNGNTLTQDKVLRREFRVSEGDAFNSIGVKRSTNRIKSLGFFQENFEIEQVDGSAPDRIVLEANVEENPTGELQLSAGFSSIESFILAASIRQRNFRGRGQTVGASVNYSRFSRSFNLSFTEPYVFDRNISTGIDIYRRDFNSFNFRGGDRNTTFEQATTGASIRVGVPLSEYMSLVGSYTFNYDDISLDENQFFADFDGDGVRTCEPLLAGRFLCDAIGKRTSSILGATLAFDNLDSRFRPTRGESISLTTEFAGLGGTERYIRLRSRGAKYWPVLGNFIFSVQAEGGFIKGLKDRGPGVDDVRLNDRFFLGEPQFRGFDIRGVGPRIIRTPLVDDDADPLTPRVPTTNEDLISDDAIGGTGYYLGRAELEIPLGTGARELGLRPSVFLDVGALFGVDTPNLQNFPNGVQARDADSNLLFIENVDDGNGGVTPTQTTNPIAADLVTPNTPLILPNSFISETFLGDSVSPRVSIGIGVNWNSPFGPFRIDFAHVLRKQPGDDTKKFTFNVGTQF
ncbi:outer membrane protein assembly factor BamA [Pontixanthobacter aquaemixtae]|uniref:Outer membrane protein assembly factor BamA n=1 Tax=Pontixanthobacter aquaemixtae TaxID=1958940 RepID=A0A844ZS62_9SPHN|nr:outer membrane protein assembly factor BamA [Pontixanthobacter aquaemixtae]MXO89836.1 outer membrane protein assembly factor BamA [Pontixanthobacter aquaemixtae]